MFTLNQVLKPQHKRNKPTARQRGAISPKVRQQLAERSQGVCERCGRGGVALQAAHVTRRWQIDGRTTVDDLLHLCVPCHVFADTTKEGRDYLRLHNHKGEI